VEDFTGLGQQELAAGLVRTSLPLEQTFVDDPLHLHRLTRFASQLGFAIVPHSKAARKLQEMKAFKFSSPLTPNITHTNQPSLLVWESAIKNKISSEHIGIEIKKMVKGCNPHTSLRLIHEVDLYHEIFALQIQDLPVLRHKI